MMYPLVRDLAATGARLRVPVAVTCRVLGFSKQGYYRWLQAPVSARDYDDAYLANAAFDVHADDPGYEYRFISDELGRLGLVANERPVWRICSQQQLWNVFAKKKSKRPRPGPPVHDDLVQRQLAAHGANSVWLTDITEHQTMEGKLYLCAIKDVFSNRIVGYSIDSRIKSRLAGNALNMAVSHRRNPALHR